MMVNRSMPNVSVIPELAYPDVGEAIDWLCRAYGFTLRLRIGNHRAQLNAGNGAIAVTERPDGASHPIDQPFGIMIRVENVDHHYQNALQHDADILQAPTDHPYGERQYIVRDLCGYRWTFSQTIADVDPEAWGGTLS
ncbi:VOC family protein [Bradyrhizobium sp. SYSU BS000235]|uniref:VOC family protein n=1 Tax=Bradyrhizobium sp. SYSU BS000235 TaxID=3411332 RepID=UPI003C783968